MQTKYFIYNAAIALTCVTMAAQSDACTGITMTAKDKSVIVARTVDWSGSKMNNIYVVSPRGHTEQSLLPDGKKAV